MMGRTPQVENLDDAEAADTPHRAGKTQRLGKSKFPDRGTEGTQQVGRL